MPRQRPKEKRSDGRARNGTVKKRRQPKRY